MDSETPKNINPLMVCDGHTTWKAFFAVFRAACVESKITSTGNFVEIFRFVMNEF